MRVFFYSFLYYIIDPTGQIISNIQISDWW